MVVIYFIYGLVFFSAGVLLGFQSRLSPAVLSRRSLAFLAAFALTHGWFEWAKMLELTSPSHGGTWKLFDLVLLVVSFAFLIQFAIEVLASHTRVPTWTRVAGPALLVLIVLGVAGVAMRNGVAILSAEVAVRYALGLPGSVLAALALLAVRRDRGVDRSGDRLGRRLLLAAVGFAVYGLITGAVVPRAAFFPASWLNADAFLSATGVRVEILRAACGLLIAMFLSEAFVVENAREHADWERRREEFISVVAHDLRSPISAITMGTDALQRLLDPSEKLDPDKARKIIRHVKTSATRLDRMVSDLLDTSRLEARRLELRLQTVELPAILRDVIYRAEAAATGHPLKLIVPESLPLVVADPARFEQLLANLLSNAAKYSTPESEIRIEAFRRDVAVEIAVTNVGEGLRPEEQARLFTRFYRTGSHRGKGEGIGLGLYITKGLVEAHGGHIWVDSMQGAYATFSFTLPYAPAADSDDRRDGDAPGR